eukprot:TRINITY_DN9413_c0_g1_i2.p1 TRINITY_DN9413_c0_g1~~TRINITY_DN9413_c0_g1_i2.p1  ORF type:complete len:528 (-),score=128.85 TRINITY_DN9413_c0_g1_i2:80-1663(-)
MQHHAEDATANEDLTMNSFAIDSPLPRFTLSTPQMASGFNSPMTPQGISSPTGFPVFALDATPCTPPLSSTPDLLASSIKPKGRIEVALRKNVDRNRKVLFPDSSTDRSRSTTRLSTQRSSDVKPSTKNSTRRSLSNRTSMAPSRSSIGLTPVMFDNPGQESNKENKNAPFTPLSFAGADADEVFASDAGTVVVMALLKTLGSAYKLLCQYRCLEALSMYQKLSESQYNTGYVLSQVARAHYEMVNYREADECYAQVRRLEPYRTEGMEVYSSVLWHLKKTIDMSHLAHQMIESERDCATSWVVLGNCFSLQKEHESSIKFFSRALQLDPNFAYAHSLCGHEHLASDDLEKAGNSYRSALRIDTRHYTAWYGLGMIYFRQEKYDMAEYHFRRALQINSISSVLHCYLGVALKANKKREEALKYIDMAIEIDPYNILARYNRAVILASLEEYEMALQEAESLQESAPREAPIYFLMGKIHRKLNDIPSAIFYLTSALDMAENKHSNYIKNVIDRIDQADGIDDLELSN